MDERTKTKNSTRELTEGELALVTGGARFNPQPDPAGIVSHNPPADLKGIMSHNPSADLTGIASHNPPGY